MNSSSDDEARPKIDESVASDEPDIPTNESDEDEPRTPSFHVSSHPSSLSSPKSDLRVRTEKADKRKIKPISEITTFLESLKMSMDKISTPELDLDVDIIQAIDMTPDELLGRISEILKDCISFDSSGGLIYTFHLPSRGRTWQKYSKQLGRVVLLNTKLDDRGLQKNMFTRSSTKTNQVAKADGLFEVLAIMRELLKEKRTISKRTMFYCSKRTFVTQDNSDALLEDVACLIGCKRKKLPIYAEPKGMVGGMLTFTHNREMYDCRRNNGFHIPVEVDEIEMDNIGAKCVIVIEKRTSYGWLMNERFYEKIPCILLTGGGQLDVATKLMLQKLSLELKLPVFALTDCNIYGLSIFMTYLVGSQSMSYGSGSLCTTNVKWLGIKPSDIEEYKIPRDLILSFSKKEVNLMNDAIWLDHIESNAEFLKEFNIMMDRKQKIEIDDMFAHGLVYLTTVYLMDKFYLVRTCIGDSILLSLPKALMTNCFRV